jgi:hypothetical protein
VTHGRPNMRIRCDASLYCARGEVENVIKLHKAELSCDHTSGRDTREPVPPDTAHRRIFAQSRAQTQDHRHRLAGNPFVNIDRQKAALGVEH